MQPNTSPGPVIRLTEDSTWEHTADVVIVGGGIAGTATFVNVLANGDSALMLDKASEPGGTSAKASAGMMVPNNRFQVELGQDDPKVDFIRFLARVGRPLLYDPNHPTLGLPQWEYDLICLYWDTSAVGLERLESLGALETQQHPGLSSYNELPEDKARFGRVVWPRQGDAVVGGAQCLQSMRVVAERLGGTILTRHRVDGVYVDAGGAVVGVHAGTDDGAVRVRALKGVVYATGGFVHNPELAREYLNGLYPGGCAARTGEGDFIPVAKALGAPLYHMHSAWGAPLLLEQALEKDPALIANFAFPGDSNIEVNKYGRRVGNEKATYNDRTQAHFIWDPAHTEYSNWLQFAIWDERCATRYARAPGLNTGNFIPPRGGAAPANATTAAANRALVGAAIIDEEPADTTKHIVRGETLEELASELDKRLATLAVHTGGVRLDGAFVERLRSTIARFNEMAARGADEDFSRGETAIEQYVHGPRAADNTFGNKTMFPIADSGPYYATILAPGAIDTKGGPKVNTRLEVLNGVDEPIPGLYAVGNCAASASGQAYWSGGGTWGPYIGFAYAVARVLHGEPPRRINSAS